MIFIKITTCNEDIVNTFSNRVAPEQHFAWQPKANVNIVLS